LYLVEEESQKSNTYDGGILMSYMMVIRRCFSTVTKLVLTSALTLLATYAQAAPTKYATQVLADKPIGYWRLGEAPGTSAAVALRGDNGTYSGGITLGQPGLHGGDTAALFDGATGRIVVPNSSALNPRNITMEAKVSWSGPNGLQQRILEKSSFAELAQYGLNVLDSGHVLVELRTTTSGTLRACEKTTDTECFLCDT
jgi:hypothetical protein